MNERSIRSLSLSTIALARQFGIRVTAEQVEEKISRGHISSQNDLEQFMLIEDLYKSVDTMQKHLDSMANNKINIEFLNKQMDKVITDIEKLKDADRDIKYENGNH